MLVTIIARSAQYFSSSELQIIANLNPWAILTQRKKDGGQQEGNNSRRHLRALCSGNHIGRVMLHTSIYTQRRAALSCCIATGTPQAGLMRST